MPEQPAKPIPPDFAEAFDQAVLVYEQWTPEQEVRQFWIGQKFYSIADLCRRVQRFTGPLPEPVYQTLRSYMRDHSDGLTRILHIQPELGVCTK